MYKNATSQEEKQRFLSSLCSFRDKNLLLKTLNLSLTPMVRSQNMQLPVMRTPQIKTVRRYSGHGLQKIGKNYLQRWDMATRS